MDKRTRHRAVTNTGAADNSIPMCANLLGLALIGLGHPAFAILLEQSGLHFSDILAGSSATEVGSTASQTLDPKPPFSTMQSFFTLRLPSASMSNPCR